MIGFKINCILINVYDSIKKKFSSNIKYVYITNWQDKAMIQFDNLYSSKLTLGKIFRSIVI